MFAVEKKIKELFALTLNGITASVRCIFYDSCFKRYIARLVTAQANKKDDEK